MGNNLKQIVFLSGKGGTGKTTLSSALFRENKNRITLDCDVDAANLYLLLDPVNENKNEFVGGKKAAINEEKCTSCGLCETLCRFNAIRNNIVDQLACEGCGFCVHACPENAIEFNDNIAGKYYSAKIEDGLDFLYARLYPGEGNSGKLVSKLKSESEEITTEELELIIIDGPPGIGCPVNASLSGVDFAVIVTEPTLSGFHDMERLIELIQTFKTPMGIVINKYDLNEHILSDILEYASGLNLPVLGKIPFSMEVSKSINSKRTINTLTGSIKEELESIEENILTGMKFN